MHQQRPSARGPLRSVIMYFRARERGEAREARKSEEIYVARRAGEVEGMAEPEGWRIDRVEGERWE